MEEDKIVFEDDESYHHASGWTYLTKGRFEVFEKNLNVILKDINTRFNRIDEVLLHHLDRICMLEKPKQELIKEEKKDDTQRD